MLLFVENPLLLVEENVGFLSQDQELVHLIDQSDFLIIELDPLACVAISNKTVVVAPSRRVAVMDYHRVEFVGVAPMNGRLVAANESGQERVLHVAGDVSL